ncbi:PDZ domain-containing protein [Paenibacillus cellulosilyticus]|uniref:endopeptidase La n=1 Tax=Paenibacillus cellulosilyticus TaxID=375489 RepID=A0A2V2YMK1_9BACL|nr:SepM family pheromone-processing serine protease [Paenibacillus cellulosilyticus]PWV95697.1 PDZ domain-containing protein [Paenibacillus cellulosilyticus]QKS47668.1 PDZ domain-containing protein [Paenibacillus cellulosilyticus]
MKWFRQRLTRWVIAFIALYLILFLLPTPYYLYQPGTVEPLHELVTVEQGQKQKSAGSFNLTTVYSQKARNVVMLIKGILDSDTEVRKTSDVQGNLTDKEYVVVLKHMMSSSQQTAVASALSEAGLQVDKRVTGLFLRMLVAGSKAEGVLEVGDILLEVDDRPAQSLQAVSSYITSQKKVGDIIEAVILRDSEERTVQIELVAANAQGVPGIGAVFEPEYVVTPSRRIDFAESDIGGPSAGLMFSLEILDQLLPEDLTHGLKIAGTGTIDMNGNVGQIGGMRDKIIAAHQAGVVLFFCPKDQDITSHNAQEAIDEAKKRGYDDLRIVPVSTLKEAVEYLRNNY